MSADLEVAESPKPQSDTMYEFGFSKKSSDSFTAVLIQQLADRLEFVKSIGQVSTLQAKDTRPPVSYPAKSKIARSFEDLFYNPELVDLIISTLKQYEILNAAGSWVGLTNKYTEILALIDVLVEKRYIRKHKQTEMGRIFCEKFGIELKDRALRTKPQVYYDTLDEYKKIIPDLK